MSSLIASLNTWIIIYRLKILSYFIVAGVKIWAKKSPRMCLRYHALEERYIQATTAFDHWFNVVRFNHE